MEKFVPLNIKCPQCKRTLMDPYHTLHNKPSILFNIECKGVKGKMRLCSYYGCYDQKANIDIEDKQLIKFYCPSCGKELTSKNLCEECDAPMVPLSMEKGGRIYICSRKGCNKHYLNFENVSDGLRKMYNDFGYF